MSAIFEAEPASGGVLAQNVIHFARALREADAIYNAMACFDPRADGDSWDAKPNPEYVYFAVDDLEEYFRRVSGQPSGKILRAVETQPWGERSFYCQDPFGNKLCFVEENTKFTGGLV